MKPEETIQLIIVKKGGDLTLWKNPQQDTIETDFTAGQIANWIAKDWREELNLPTDQYDLYIKIPTDVVLKSIALERIEAILLVPTERQPYRRG